MFPGLNPKKVQAMMKKMGMAQQEIPAKKIIIETSDNNIIINNPSVIKINMKGQETFQISGDVEGQPAENEEQPVENNMEQDIKTIMEKVNCLEQEAKIALEKANGDLTEAILSLS